MNDNNDFYKALRSFNSFVKTYILETIISEKLTDKNDTEFVIDLAAGKGQDVARLSNLGFKTGLFIDNDKNAISELLNRKHNLKTINNHQIKILIQNIDLKENYSDIINKINLLEIKKNSADVIICNFAIHYIIINEDQLLNLIKLLDEYLKPNGRFIFTCFDGERVFNILRDANEWNNYENNNLKYSIKKLYKSDQLSNYGQKTELSLPFDSLLDEFKSANEKVYNELSSSDKEFIKLYQFNIVKKNQANSIISKSNLSSLYKNVTCKNELIKEDNGNLEYLRNFTKSNRILLIINCQIENILNNLISTLEERNYKNFYKFKKNKNNICKVTGFSSGPNNYKNVFLEHMEQFTDKKEFNSIVLIDKSFNYSEFYDELIIKKSTIPIILNDGRDKNIIIINPDLLKEIYESNMYTDHISDFQNIKKYIEMNDIFYIHN